MDKLITAQTIAHLRKSRVPTDVKLAEEIRKDSVWLNKVCENCHHCNPASGNHGSVWCNQHKFFPNASSQRDCFTPCFDHAELLHAAGEARALYLPQKTRWFDDYMAGIKPFEYRLRTPYWDKRIKNREYDTIVLTKGYPSKSDTSRRIILPWLGYELQTVKSPEWNNRPRRVYAIHLAGRHAPAPALPSIKTRRYKTA